MRRLLIGFGLLTSVCLHAQTGCYNYKTDSVTYQYFLDGDWQQLIDTGKKALTEGVDFKYLRQRLGYAYFVNKNYYAAKHEYEQSLKFDPCDSISHQYLFYCGLNTGDISFARYEARKVADIISSSYDEKSQQLFSGFDLEYNFFANKRADRGNPQSVRLGLNSKLNYRLSLYQSIGYYSQTNKTVYTDNSTIISTQWMDSTRITQVDYLLSCGYRINRHLQLNMAYHFLLSQLHSYQIYRYSMDNHKYRTTTDSVSSYPGNLIYTQLSYDIKRLRLGVSGSVFNHNHIITQQYGMSAEARFSGTYFPYLKSTVYYMHLSNKIDKLIFDQTAGIELMRKIWLESFVTFGNLDYFSDHNGLYVYNSPDPVTFRCGLTGYYKLSSRASFFAGYCYHIKEIQTKKTTYNQHTFSGGIIWKF